MLDAFQGHLDFKDVMGLPIPFLDELFEVQIEHLTEKNKAEAEAIAAAKRG